MNHLQALKALEQQSKQANGEVKKIIANNMRRLERGLQNQTKNELRVFQKNLKSILTLAHNEHRKAIRQTLWLSSIPLAISCLLLAGVGFWSVQKANTLSHIATLTSYPTQPYQGNQYAIVPKANTLQDKNGNYWIKLK